MLKILIVDDEANIREVVKEYARVSGYEADEARDGLEALSMVKKSQYDCVIMDIMMPRLDGFSAGRKIKEISDIPLIMLSARQEVEDKLAGFDLGADDYVTKPFSPRELMARIRVVCERHGKNLNTEFRHNTFVLNFASRVLMIDDEEVMLTPKEMDLLIYLVNNPNIALDRDRILSSVWGYDYYGDERTVDTHIKMLRRNLGPYKDLIQTVRAVGYKFEVQA